MAQIPIPDIIADPNIVFLVIDMDKDCQYNLSDFTDTYFRKCSNIDKQNLTSTLSLYIQRTDIQN